MPFHKQSGDRKYKVFVVSLFCLKTSKLIVGTKQRSVSMYLLYSIQITVTRLLIRILLQSFRIIEGLEYDLYI